MFKRFGLPNICGYHFILGSVFLFISVSFTVADKSDQKIWTNNLNFEHYSVQQGLSNNKIHCILQDRKGWMWFGTSQGVCRFDGYRFSVFKHDSDDPTSLEGDLVRTIFEDHKGQLWIGTENGGLNKYNREKETFEHFFFHNEPAVLRNVKVTSIQDDKEGNLLICARSNLYKIENENKLIEIKPSNLLNSAEFYKVIFFDQEGRLLIGTNLGLYVYHTDTNLAEKVKFKSAYTNFEICTIVPEEDGTFLIGTELSGMYVFNPRTIEASQIIIDPKNERSNSVRAISKDREGHYWIGTRGGLYKYQKGIGVIAFYCNDKSEPSSLHHNSIQCIFLDRKDDVWIGTGYGVNFLDRKRQNILTYKSLNGEDRYLNNSEVYSFWLDSKGDIWTGTESGGINILNRKTGKFRYLASNKNNPNSLSSDCVKSMIQDKNGNLWIGTYLGGLNIYNLRTRDFKHFRNDPKDPTSLSNDRVWSLLRDSNNDIWIGTSSGLDKYNPLSGSFTHNPELVNNQHVNWVAEDRDHSLWIGCTDSLIIYNPKNREIKKFKEATISMFIDSKNKIWLTTRNQGFALFSKEKGVIRYYSEKDGLSNNQTKAILEDEDHILWISTTAGLSKFDPEKERFHNFFVKNGFLNDQYNYGAALKLPTGELVFGGISGFNIIDPRRIKSGDFSAPMIFTNIKVMDKSVRFRGGKNDILKKCISEAEEITLTYKQNSIEVEFALLEFSNVMDIQYSYFLEGLETDWKEPSYKRNAIYTNLNPGKYVLHVKRVPGDINDIQNELVLRVIILPPISQTWWFKVLTLLTVIGIVVLLILFIKKREKLKNNVELEKLKAKKLHDLDTMKLRLYTNISHEIRTPLTLILGPLQKLKNHTIPDNEINDHVDVMLRNANHLHRLINQLLDFRKIESGNMKLNLKRGDLVSFIREIISSFSKYAEEKEIELDFHTVRDEIFVNFDDDKVAKILNNLLSNALKFTNKRGKITINISLVFDTEENNDLHSQVELRMIEISVKDTGIGISETDQQKIFDRFFQVTENSMNTGTGIGLALTKELVHLLKGSITVNSKPGEGSKFTLHIPYDDAKLSESSEGTALSGFSHEISKESNNDKTAINTVAIDQKIMLLVDDNSDVRFFLRTHFSSEYQVFEASDGLEGWEIALRTIPDIIISDVLMTGMNGFDFCSKIRNDERTSHIPILLLTALGSGEHEIEGLHRGADAFITKPFDPVILQTKVESIISIRHSLKQKYLSETFLQPQNIILTSPDDRFLQKAIDVIEKYISDPDFDVDCFAMEMGVSRIQLYRKFQALTKLTVKEFVWKIRLKRAAQLLVQHKMNISEVAYSTGYSHLSHFRKYFKQEFGMSASEYIKNHISEQA
jgi:signal transduction histidine kinase/ligand-binding sensor domain-containing protein/DNA-binding response OmpR family regulator